MNGFLDAWLVKADRPRVVIVGNEKGGSGKSTIAIHLIGGFLAKGMRVGSLDLDGRQGTLSRFVDNRRHQAAVHDFQLPMPEHRRVSLSRGARDAAAEGEKLAQVATALESLAPVDVIVVDTPGSDSVLCRAAHVLADVLVTPLNASYLDLDALVAVDETAERIIGPSAYAELVLYMMEKRREMGVTPLKWIVATNRLSSLDTKVARSVAQVLETLAPRLDFVLAEPVRDRVVFRELFLRGMTIFDQPRQSFLGLSGGANARGLREMESLVALVGDGRRAGGRPAPRKTPAGAAPEIKGGLAAAPSSVEK